MTDNLPAIRTGSGREIVTRTIKACGNCTFFVPRGPADPWPVAGTPSMAEGRCGHPRFGTSQARIAEQRRPWQTCTDHCVEWKAA